MPRLFARFERQDKTGCSPSVPSGGRDGLPRGRFTLVLFVKSRWRSVVPDLRPPNPESPGLRILRVRHFLNGSRLGIEPNTFNDPEGRLLPLSRCVRGILRRSSSTIPSFGFTLRRARIVRPTTFLYYGAYARRTTKHLGTIHAADKDNSSTEPSAKLLGDDGRT